MNKNLILGIGILALSILNILFTLLSFVDFSILISLLGITSFILQILKKDVYRSLQLIWVIAQIPLITIIEKSGGTTYETDILNLAQLFTIKFQFGLTYASKTFSIGVNALALIYLTLIKFLRSQELIGIVVSIIPNTSNSKYSEYAPLTAKVSEYSKKWFSAILTTPIKIDGSEFDLIRFNRNDNGFFNPQKECQICSIYLASTVHKHEISDSGFIKSLSGMNTKSDN